VLDEEAGLPQLLDAISLAVLEVDAAWTVSRANSSARRILDSRDPIALVEDRLFFARARDAEAATRWWAGSEGGSDRPLVLPRLHSQVPLLMHVFPAASPAESGRKVRRQILLVDPAQTPSPPPSVMVEAFGLTRAEAGIALALARGLTLAECATEARITTGTARRHLENIFRKTGARRQVEVVRLVLGAGTHVVLPGDARATLEPGD
jgi:DNA-binding CsgD family transcriptional regulator